jgi:WhiB family redox-sensing transcriptional regulator
MSNNPWWRYAACRGVDVNVFYPSAPARQVDIRKATAYCDDCPVVDECLAEAVLFDDRDGIWGGKTPPQRGAQRRKPRVPRPPRLLPVVGKPRGRSAVAA